MGAVREFLRLYGRAIVLLGADRRVALRLAFANILVVILQFVDPLLFGRIIGQLAGAAPTVAGMAGLIGLWAALGGFGIAAAMLTGLFADRMAHRNRLRAMQRFFEQVLALPPSFHGQTQSGRLMSVMLSGTHGLFHFWLNVFREHIGTVVACLVLMPASVLLNWRLAIALIVLVVAYGVIAAAVIGRTEARQRRAQRHHVALAGTAQDALTNLALVQSFAHQPQELHRFGAIADDVIAEQYPVLAWWAVTVMLTRAASTIVMISVVTAGVALHAAGEASVGQIVTFLGLALLLVGRLDQLLRYTSELVAQMSAIGDFFAVLDARGIVADPPDMPALRIPPGGAEIRFENVSFAYADGPPVLHDVSFSAPAGRVVALVGHTGAGKSTVIALLQRFWDPVGGRITIAGQDLRAVSLDSLRRTIGVVFQDSQIFNRSIRENLLVGRPEASQADIERACRAADAHDFILAQRDGYNTIVGERGAALSGGQRQRLAIARALLKDPPLLLLDEATSALDAETEARVAGALATLMRGRTTLVIAHRLSTVRGADEILVFAQGRIVERGGFASLMAQQGRFASLVAAQLAAP